MGTKRLLKLLLGVVACIIKSIKFHSFKPSRRVDDASRRHFSAGVLVNQLVEAFSQLGVPHRLLVHFLLELLVRGDQQAAVVGRLVEDVQLGRLVHIRQSRHAVLQLVVVVFQVDSPLTLHPVVEVSDLSALVLGTLS